MKRIKFLRDVIYETEGYQKGPSYKEGSTHDFEDDFADRWLRRQAAVEVNTRAPMSADPPSEPHVDGIEPPKPEDAPKDEPKPKLGIRTLGTVKAATRPKA